MKYNKTKKILLMSIIVCAIMLIFPQPAAAAFKYVLLEAFPGFFTKGQELTDLPEMVLAIYKFGIWTVGICGLLMMTVGGVMYMGSAGNNAAAESAKKIISDSLLGIIVALGAYLFVYVINPDLVNITINFSKATLTSSDTTGASTGDSTATGKNTGSGTCEAITSGACSTENLKSAFGSNAEKMSKVCNRESRGNTALESKTDLCMDGNSFSIGLFQVNLMNSAGSISGCDGSQMFSGTGSRSSSYACNDYKTNSSGVKYCAHRKCTVTNISKYNECKTKLMNGDTNIQVAKKLYSASGFNPWKTSAGLCSVK